MTFSKHAKSLPNITPTPFKLAIVGHVIDSAWLDRMLAKRDQVEIVAYAENEAVKVFAQSRGHTLTAYGFDENFKNEVKKWEIRDLLISAYSDALLVSGINVGSVPAVKHFKHANKRVVIY